MSSLRALVAFSFVLAGCVSSPPYPSPMDAPGRPAASRSAKPQDLGDNVRAVSPGGGFFEASIAAAPNGSKRMVIGVRGTAVPTNYLFNSADGGVTWSGGNPLRLDAANGKTYNRYGDPVVVADRHGRFYISSLIFHGSAPHAFTGIAVSHSDDGVNWSQPALVHEIDHTTGSRAFDDKEWLAVDDTDSRFTGSVYVLWQQLEFLPIGRSIIHFARSRDRGVTWDAPLALTDLAPAGLCMLDVGPSGEIYAAYSRANEGFVGRVSWDGGESFSPPVPLVPASTVSGGPVEGTTISFPGAPQLVTDRSGSAHSGNAYFVHITRGRRSDGVPTKAIGVARSIDRGLTWSAPQEVSQTTAGDSFFPMAAVDRATGNLVVAWYDRRESPGARRARLYATWSGDGGTTFSTPRAVSGEFSLETAWIGEYYTVTAHNGSWTAAFSDGAGHLSAADMQLGQPQAPSRRTRAVRK